MSEAQAKKLVEEGIEAIEHGEKAVGRGKLEAAVKIDPYSEQAWLWLAKVVSSVEEKRTCLGNVILINPANKEAQIMLDKLEGVKDAAVESGMASAVTAVAGKSQQNRRLLGLIVALVVLIICLAGFALLGGGGDEVVVPTVFITATDTYTPDPAGTSTALASITPTITLTPTTTPARLSATWTFTPGPSNTPLPEEYPVPPAELTGRIIMQSGNVTGDPDNQPIAVISPANLTTKLMISPEGVRGQKPALFTDANYFVWSLYSPGTRAYTLQIQPFGVDLMTSVASLYNNDPLLADPNYATLSGGNLAFSAQLLGSNARDLWLIPVGQVVANTTGPTFGQTLEPTATLTPTLLPSPTLAEGEPTIEVIPPTPVPSPLIQLTNSEADETWLSFDSTGTALVYVATEDGITDLWVVNTTSLQVFVLTNNQNALVESAPDWSGDNEIVFSGTKAGTETSDIYLMNADGQSEPEVLFDFGPQDIQPRFSPDGRYIVFSSDKNGSWDVFIYDRELDTFYQVEVNPETTDIANDWAG